MKLIIVGGKGNGTVVLSTLVDMIENYDSKLEFIGFVNEDSQTIKEIDGFPVIGHFAELENLCKKHNAYFINGITSVKTICSIAEKYSAVFPNYEDRLVNIIHPSVHFGYKVQKGKGIFIGPQCYVGQNVDLGDMVFIHAQCYVARDSCLGNFTYLAPQAYIGAEATIDESVYMGVNSLVKERVHVRKNCIVGLGAIIVKDTEKDSLY
jgi:sugar O-acyltransferase (sialic acid O-acetyltransferase NeuD family)